MLGYKADSPKVEGRITRTDHSRNRQNEMGDQPVTEQSQVEQSTSEIDSVLLLTNLRTILMAGVGTIGLGFSE